MMPKTLSLKILTPQATLLSLDDITMVVCPAREGEIGIMLGHLSLITTLCAGEIKVFKGTTLIFSLSIHAGQKGILNVSPTLVTILFEEFCPVRFAVKVYGISCLKTPLSIESRSCGSYKIESEILEYLTQERRQFLENYLKMHKGVLLSVALLKELDEKAA